MYETELFGAMRSLVFFEEISSQVEKIWPPSCRELPLVFRGILLCFCHILSGPRGQLKYREGTIHLDQKGSFNIEDLSWLQDPLAGTYSVSRLLFHALEWVEALLYSFQETNNPIYLTLAKKLTLMWMRECLDREGTGNIWSDHGTALRAVVLCRLWVLSRTHPNLRILPL